MGRGKDVGRGGVCVCVCARVHISSSLIPPHTHIVCIELIPSGVLRGGEYALAEAAGERETTNTAFKVHIHTYMCTHVLRYLCGMWDW